MKRFLHNAENINLLDECGYAGSKVCWDCSSENNSGNCDCIRANKYVPEGMSAEWCVYVCMTIECLIVYLMLIVSVKERNT